MKLFGFILLLTTGLFQKAWPPQPAHTFYVSITDIRYQPESSELQIKVKAFTDDLERALP